MFAFIFSFFKMVTGALHLFHAAVKTTSAMVALIGMTIALRAKLAQR